MARPDPSQRELFGNRSPWAEDDARRGTIATVVLPEGIEKPLDYLVPEALAADVEPGRRVRVPLGRANRETLAYCVAVRHGELPQAPLKPVSGVEDPRPLLSPRMIELTRWMAARWLARWGEVLEAVLPAGVRLRHKRRRVPLVVAAGTTPARRPSPAQARVLEAAVTPRTRLFLLCNPHNPLGRVWRRAELERLAEFCARHRLILCSDEIHCDLILDPALPHVPAASLGADAAARTLTLMAPSKTFNVPGLGTSLAIIPDAALRRRFERAAAGIVAEVTCLGFTACEAAYRDGEPWRQALLDYLRGNRDLLLARLARDFPHITVEAPVEATYLLWMNVAGLGLPAPAAHFEAHGVGLSDGAPFGSPPGRHLRLNFGCPRATLEEALRRMRAAVAAA